MISRIFFTRTLLAAAFSALVFSGARGATSEVPEGWEPELLPVMGTNIQKAAAYYYAGEYGKAKLFLDLLEKKTRPSPDTMTLRGAIATREKDFEKAREWLQRCLDAVPKDVNAKFNMAEVEILSGSYKLGRNILSEIPAEPAIAEKQQFYTILSFVMEGDRAEAKRLLDQMKFPSDTAAYYFAHAAYHHQAGETEKALEFVASAQKIFGRNVETTYIDLFSHLGWLKINIPSPDEGDPGNQLNYQPVPQIVTDPKPAASPAQSAQ